MREGTVPSWRLFNTDEEPFSSLSPDDEVVVYRTSPECHSSLALYVAMVDAGFDNVRRYSGGLRLGGGRSAPEGDWIRTGG